MICVIDTNFLWENLDKCIRQWEIFIRTSEPQDSTKGLTGIIDIVYLNRVLVRTLSRNCD